MILVVGGTGSVGGRVALDLAGRGERVRALCRSKSDSRPLRAAGVDVVAGDLKDAASLRHACEGADVVVTTATASKNGDDSIDDVDGQGNQNLIAAARAVGVRHIVFVSTIGASEDSPVPVFRAKAAAERAIAGSGMAYTILHCNGFMDVWFPMIVEVPLRTGSPVTLVGAASRRHSFVAEHDVAAFVSAAAREREPGRTVLEIGGPEALTFRDVVHAYEQALLRSIELRFVAPGQPIPGLPEIVWGLAASLESFDSEIPMAETARRFGVMLTDVRTFAQGRLAALSA